MHIFLIMYTTFIVGATTVFDDLDWSIRSIIIVNIFRSFRRSCRFVFLAGPSANAPSPLLPIEFVPRLRIHLESVQAEVEIDVRGVNSEVLVESYQSTTTMC